jgi:hypothetical protein
VPCSDSDSDAEGEEVHADTHVEKGPATGKVCLLSASVSKRSVRAQSLWELLVKRTECRAKCQSMPREGDVPVHVQFVFLICIFCCR